MLEPYAKLPALLELQRQALASGDEQELASISGQIDELSRQIAEAGPKLEELDPATRKRLRTLITQAQAEVNRNMDLWQESLEQIRQAGEDLQANRRYFHRFQNVEKSGRRFSKRG
jgi:chromosome segregation ATPase